MLKTMPNLLYDIWREIRFYYCQLYKRICKFTMDLLPNNWKHLLKTETFKRKIPFKALYPYKGTRKVKGFQKLSNKEIYFTLQSYIIVKINTTNLSDSFHGQTSLKNTIFSVKKTLMDMYFLSSINLFNFSFPLNPVIHRMGNTAKILCPSPDVENRKCFSPILYFITGYPFNLF